MPSIFRAFETRIPPVGSRISRRPTGHPAKSSSQPAFRSKALQTLPEEDPEEYKQHCQVFFDRFAYRDDKVFVDVPGTVLYRMMSTTTSFTTAQCWASIFGC